MDVNFVFLLCIALIFSADSKADGEAQLVSSSNLTDTRFGVVTDHSKNTTNDTKLGETKGSDVESSKIEGKGGIDDESGKTKEEALSKSSRKKDGVHGEECDPSNMCSDEEHQFVACLRVPGNDSPHLSLLIQNKAKTALTVTITAPPGFVRLEKNKVQLLENEDTKVKVSIKKGGSNDSSIILTSGKGHCRLELKDLTAAHETENDDTVAVSRPSILNIRPRTLIVIIMISFLVLSLVIIPIIIHVYRNKSRKYQRLDMELPVSKNTVMMSKSDQETGDDGWNNNWGDDWDDENGDGDEEQPHTPVLPLTPSLSSRGLASRRLSKEGWKD